MRTSHRSGSRLAWAAVLPLGFVLALAGGLAWTAIDADRSQRLAAQGTVSDYADFAAFILAGEAEARLRQALFYAFYREEVAWRRDGARADPADLLADPQETARCAENGDGRPRWTARLVPGEGSLATAGDIDAATRDWIADTLRVFMRTPPADVEDAGHLFAPRDGGGGLVAYRVRRGGPDSAAVAAYALASCLSDRDGPVLDGALADAPLLPPSLVGDAGADSLLSVRVTHPDAGVLYRSRPQYASAYSGAVRLAAPGAGARLEVTLRPDVAERLFRASVGPYSRAPLALGLLAATVALLLVAAVLLVRAVRLTRLRERFVADVSHELRTPLQQVLLFAQLLRIGQARSGEERVRFLAIIEREALRLIALVERVLEFARPEGVGDGDDGAHRADVAAVVREAVDAIGPLLAERNARVSLDLPDTAVARASADAVHQIVVNLVDNALKYGPAGQSIDIRIATGDEVSLEVADDGPGVPAAQRPRVWEPFYRLEREAGAARAGSGIGLAVVRELADRFGAIAEVEDAPGGGALFRVRFQPAAP